jgi:hypothetical protein
MTGAQPFQIPNRRTSPVDRRQRQDRRTHPLPNQQAAEENETLHELLRDAHERIRRLEQAVERLTDDI